MGHTRTLDMSWEVAMVFVDGRMVVAGGRPVCAAEALWARAAA
jgi:hypothetical protein